MIKMKTEKIAILLLLGIMIATPVSALVIDLFGNPVTTANVITLHQIWKDANYQDYGWNETNDTCAPVHFQVPYKQNYGTTYIKFGYVPICDVNQSIYSHHFLTVFCNGEYVATYNYTDNCVDYGGAGIYEFEWLALDWTDENLTAGLFQTTELTTVFSCMICVNDTEPSPNRTDFWIRTENVGNMVTTEYHNETVIEGLEDITDGIQTSVEFTLALITLAYNTFNMFAFVWVIVGVPMFVLFMIRQLVDRFRTTFPKRRKRR
jgi:hypothetical protein